MIICSATWTPHSNRLPRRILHREFRTLFVRLFGVSRRPLGVFAAFGPLLRSATPSNCTVNRSLDMDSVQVRRFNRIHGIPCRLRALWSVRRLAKCFKSDRKFFYLVPASLIKNVAPPSDSMMSWRRLELSHDWFLRLPHLRCSYKFQYVSMDVAIILVVGSTQWRVQKAQ